MQQNSEGIQNQAPAAKQQTSFAQAMRESLKTQHGSAEKQQVPNKYSEEGKPPRNESRTTKPTKATQRSSWQALSRTMPGLHHQARISSLSGNKVNLPEKRCNAAAGFRFHCLHWGRSTPTEWHCESRRMVTQCVVRRRLFTNVTDTFVHSCSPGKEKGERGQLLGEGTTIYTEVGRECAVRVHNWFA